MSDPNPNEATPTQTPSKSSFRFLDSIVVGIWLLIPIGMFIAYLVALPIFEDFGVELPMLTKSLLSLYSVAVLALIASTIAVAIFAIPNGNLRSVFLAVALTTGVVVAVFWCMSLLVPFISLRQNLS